MDADKIRAAFLEKFQQVANDRIDKLNDLFDMVLDAPLDAALADDLARELHTLKGESRMMGFAQAGKVIHAVEDAVKAHRAKGFEKLAGFKKLFQESLDTVSDLANQSGPVDVEPLCKRLENHESEGDASSEDDDDAADEDDASHDQPASVSATAEVGKPQEQPEANPQAGPKKEGYQLSKLVRVSANKLDRLSDMVGDLFSSYLRMNQLTRTLDGLTKQIKNVAISSGHQSQVFAEQEEGLTNSLQEINREISEFKRGYIERTASMASVLDQLLDQVSDIRLLPVSDLFNLYRTAARDIARQLQKRIRVDLEGESTLVDRSILDALGDIMLHMIRNSIDHGIEAQDTRKKAKKDPVGRLILGAKTVNDRIQIQVIDDGGGIDPKRIKELALSKGLVSHNDVENLDDEDSLDLIFLPGFTTAKTTTDLSGRGVGMDVVRSKLLDLGGSVQVSSQVGQGTCFTLEVPTSIAIARVLLFRVGDQTYAILATFVRRVERIDASELIDSPSGQAIVVDGQTAAAVVASDLLRLGNTLLAESRIPMVVIEHGGRILALLVDELMGERELTIKPFSPFLSGVRTISGAATLEDGTLILVLHAGELTTAGSRVKRGLSPAAPMEEKRTSRVLLVEDSLITRELERSVLVSFGLDVEEAGDGYEALEKLASGEFDIIVSDVEMPRLNGFELTRRVKQDERWAAIPVILVTTLGGEEDRRRGMQAGADGYIVKSEFGSQSFIDMVRRFLP